MAVANFELETGKPILAATRRVERIPTDKVGQRVNRPPPQNSFWALLVSPGGLNGLFWSWVRIAPSPQLPTPTDPYTIQDVPVFVVSEPCATCWENAREANLNRQVPPGTIVRLEFIGFDRAGEPAYAFNYGKALEPDDVPIHDHRDNFNGGFAFATYHPGMALPQQPFAV
jgi:hypothetical protein